MISVALVQIVIEDGDWRANLAHAIRTIEASDPADLYVLPELWTSGYDYSSWASIAAEGTPLVLDALRHLAREKRAAIAGSMISSVTNGRLANRLWFVTADSTDMYDKIHLFPEMKEDSLLAGGVSRASFQLANVKLAASICFDLRFPAMYRRDAIEGAQVFLVCAEWPAARADALMALCRSRAIENQCYLILCNRTGIAADGTAFDGQSVVVSPWGELLAECGSAEGIGYVAIDPAVVDTFRSKFPVLNREVAGID